MINKTIKIGKFISWRRIYKNVFAFNLKNQKMIKLDETGSFLWEIISKNINTSGLIKQLTDNYCVGPEEAKSDIKEFLKELVFSDFLEISGRDNVTSRIKDNNKIDQNLLLELEKIAIEKVIPFSATFEITEKCNESCIHCYMLKSRARELTTRETKRIIKELSKQGCLFISFTGGEIFTRPDLFEIISFASELNFAIDLLTNGTLINDDIIVFLKNQLIRRVQISLYSANSKTHDRITRLDGSFEKTLNSIKLLIKNDIKVEIAFPIMNVNFEERYDLRFLVEKLGAYFLPAHIITAKNDGSDDTFHLRLDNEQLRILFREDIFGYYSGRKPFQEHQFYVGFKDLKEANPCYGGINSCAINSIGDVFPCNQLFYKFGNLRNNSFSEIWNNSPEIKKLRLIKVKDLPICSECDLLPYCSRCPGLALLEGGDMLGHSPENCRITSIQANF
ncbi:MAG: PqqD family peptide modification chaperone [Patescibacteria group bacterium]